MYFHAFAITLVDLKNLLLPYIEVKEYFMLFCLIFSTFLLVLKLQKTDCHAHGSIWKNVWFNFMFEQPNKGYLNVSPMVTS